jgi:hypothetical protein
MLGGVRNCAQAGVPVPLRPWRWIGRAKVVCRAWPRELTRDLRHAVPLVQLGLATEFLKRR